MNRFYTNYLKNSLFQLVTASLVTLVSPATMAQTLPECVGPANAGGSYETCNNGTCEKFTCNGTSFMASEIWNQDGTINIDFGNDTSPCVGERTGRIRYTGNNVWEYCNGTAWTSLSGVGVTLPINGNNAILPPGRIVGVGSPSRNLFSYAGIRNIFLGDNAGGALLTGTDNTFIGYNSGSANTLGSNNIYIGSKTGELTVLASNNILIGVDIATPTLLTNNHINIGNVLSGSMQVSGTNNSTSDNSASLAIDGSLKLGTSSELCLPGNGGRMRYNNSTKKMQYCNETAWTDL